MITILKQTLRELHAHRLINYGNTAYQVLTNDWHLRNVPFELKTLWYGRDTLSSMTLTLSNDSDIDRMSHHELVRWIDNECSLISRLEAIFSDLEQQKEGNANG